MARHFHLPSFEFTLLQQQHLYHPLKKIKFRSLSMGYFGIDGKGRLNQIDNFVEAQKAAFNKSIELWKKLFRQGREGKTYLSKNYGFYDGYAEISSWVGGTESRIKEGFSELQLNLSSNNNSARKKL